MATGKMRLAAQTGAAQKIHKYVAWQNCSNGLTGPKWHPPFEIEVTVKMSDILCYPRLINRNAAL
jgi:hypothetical protein